MTSCWNTHVLYLLILSFTLFSLTVSWTVETRKSTLFPWRTASSSSSSDPIGCIVEVRERRDAKQTFQVTVGCNNHNDPITVSLPFIQTADTLASSLWPPALAGAILSQSARASFPNHASILEVGAGLGLMGQVLAKSTRASHCLITDKDEQTMKLLQDILENTPDIQAKCLEWRDTQDEHMAQTCDIVIGTDVAYYQYLLQPLLNTISHFLKPENSLLMIIGQANRESQWDLFDIISKGGYNVDLDCHETKWKGRTEMLLYQLEMTEWQQQHDEEHENNDETIVDGVVDIAVLMHATPGLLLPSLSKNDYLAQENDRDKIAMSF